MVLAKAVLATAERLGLKQDQLALILNIDSVEPINNLCNCFSKKKKLICFLQYLKAINISTMNESLLQQIKKRRTLLGLKQVDMQSRTGISRQQYQKLESHGNPRLETLEIIAAGLNAQLMLIPDDKVNLIRQLLNDEIKVTIEDQDDLMTNPWKGLLGGEEP